MNKHFLMGIRTLERYIFSNTILLSSIVLLISKSSISNKSSISSMSIKIAMANHKGGVAKTTSALNLSVAFSSLGKKVLMVDCDPQSHLTLACGVKNVSKSVYDVLCRSEGVEGSLIKINSGLDLLPATDNLAGAEVELVGLMSREQKLKKALKPIEKKYDFIFVDCPPSLGLLTINALTAVDEVYVPLQSQFLAMHGLSLLMKAVKQIRDNVNENIKIGAVFLTFHNPRIILNKNVEDVARDEFGDKFCDTFIRQNVTLAEAPAGGKDIFEYAPESNGAKDYEALAKELLTKYY